MPAMLSPRYLTGAALLFTALVIAAYVWVVGFAHPLTSSTPVWGAFGDYFGGIAGTMLSFISILLIVFTIKQQNEHELKRDLLAHVAAADGRIEHWLQRSLPIAGSMDSEKVEFGDIVWGLVNHTNVRQQDFRAAMERLLVLVAPYCEAIGVYSDNIDPYHVLQHHRSKAESLLLFLESHLNSLAHLAGPRIALCRKALDGGDQD